MAQRNQFVDGILSDKTSLIHLLDNNDAEDNSEAHVIKHSHYYGETEFSKLLVRKPGLSILSVNIQSVNAKFDEFELFVSRMNLVNPISAICLQECWLGDADNVTMFNLENYEMLFLPKSCCRHGGLIIYVHKQFECTVLTDIKVPSSGWEYLCVKLSHRKPKSKMYVLCNIYRKPNDIVNDLDTFKNEFTTLLSTIRNLRHSTKEKHLPKKTVKFNKRKHKKSKWMTYGILKSINTKDKLYKKIVKADIHDDIHYSALKAEFSEYKKILRRSINEAKHLYYTRTFALYKNDIKQTWSVIKDTLQKKHHCKTTDKFVVNNHVVTDFDEIANNFNIYFINIGKSLSDQIQSVASSQDYLLQHNKPNMTFNFIPVSEVYIDNVINKLKNKSSCGYDNISNKHIKYAKNVLTKPLTLLINQCLHTGIFPSQLKLSRVKPLFKSGDQSRFSNYRPISLLPSLSKIFERVIFDQLLGYFTNNKLLCMDQFGFRPGHSTELAALRLVDHLITQMDKCRVPTNIYIDLSKAFDTLNHDILLQKLKYYGITGTSVNLLQNYLSERYQYVEYNGHRSNTLPISTGVPQGLVLGPLLFLIYINDLPMVTDVFNMLMYADDTTLYCNINQNVSEVVINNELLKVSQWLAANKLSLNVGKTKFMVFHLRNKVVSYPDLHLNGNKIERVTQFNFLGLILHTSLSWDKHINHISLKVSKAIGILYRPKSIYPHKVLLTLYNTLILPYFNYCILSWGSTLRENHHLHLLQKKAIRIITNSNYIAHTEPLLKELRLLKVTCMFPLAIWKFYFKLMNNQLPLYFEFMKPPLPQVCTHYDIRSPVFHLPEIRHSFAEQSIRYCLIKRLNAEQSRVDIVHNTSFYNFKMSIKNDMINAYNAICTVNDCYVCSRLN